MKMLEAYMKLQDYAYSTRKGDGFHVDNAGWNKFEAEFKKFIQERKKLVESPLGAELKEKVDALRSTDQFQHLKKLWFKQCHSKSGEAFKVSFDNFLQTIADSIPLTDKPEGFEDQYFVQETLKLIGMFEETLDGHASHFMDWLFQELE